MFYEKGNTKKVIDMLEYYINKYPSALQNKPNSTRVIRTQMNRLYTNVVCKDTAFEGFPSQACESLALLKTLKCIMLILLLLLSFSSSKNGIKNAWCVHSRVVCTGNFPNIVLAVGRVYYHRRSGPLIFLLLSNIYREGEKPQHESTPITVIVKRLRFILKLSIQIMYGYLNNEMLIYYMISRYHMDTGTE